MDLKDKIALCERCSLHKNMSTSPVVPEWVGRPNNMWILNSPPNITNDLEQLPICGLNRTLLHKLFQERGLRQWYITMALKCCTTKGSYNRAEQSECLKWIDYEKSLISPKFIIVCGSMIKDIECTHHIPALHNALNNKKMTQQLINIIDEILDDKLS